MRRVAILGSTGSIGTQALDVVRNHRDEYEVVALAAARNGELLQAQAEEFGVPLDSARLCADTPHVLTELASLPEVDVVVNAVVGFAGLPATLAALEHGKRLALANKESLIAGGPVVAAVRDRGDGEIVPVDSEHSALYQCLRAGRTDEVNKLVLTASGGPFRGYSREQLATVTVSDALKRFDDAMQYLNVSQSAVAFTQSDFGRTLTSNGDGTDHAWGGVQIVTGGAVLGPMELMSRAGFLKTERFDDMVPPVYVSIGVGFRMR
jgi:1-deoxy-D-xylulose 5-phosphate reductoisomerase